MNQQLLVLVHRIQGVTVRTNGATWDSIGYYNCIRRL